MFILDKKNLKNRDLNKIALMDDKPQTVIKYFIRGRISLSEINTSLNIFFDQLARLLSYDNIFILVNKLEKKFQLKI